MSRKIRISDECPIKWHAHLTAMCVSAEGNVYTCPVQAIEPVRHMHQGQFQMIVRRRAYQLIEMLIANAGIIDADDMNLFLWNSYA